MTQLKYRAATLGLVAAVAVTACGGGSDDAGTGTTSTGLNVPKATCGADDAPESGLQGQVPAAIRQTGFKGFNCNLKLVSQLRGEGGNWSSGTFSDGAGRTCFYHSTAAPNVNRVHPGVPVIDITDRSKPVRIESLTTASMIDPWESLSVNARRQILIADNGRNSGGGPEVDVYDLSGDCRFPQLLASKAVGTGTDGGITPAAPPIGHEGNISPDGLTYYIGDLFQARYYAVDVTSTTTPKLVATFDIASLGLGRFTTAHGLSVSNDGSRVYAVVLGGFDPKTFEFPPGDGIASPDAPINGFVILDTSEVQKRLPGATIKAISTGLFRDGSGAQHALSFTVAGKPYIASVDESGSAIGGGNTKNQAACDKGLSPFPMAHLFDVSDETKPKEISKLMLETHDPRNCSQVLPDIASLTGFTYGSHYCSVDNRDNATVMACGYFESGIRVFDIRNPLAPKEIAYFNPPATPTKQAGSSHGSWTATGPDWCASRIDFDFAKKQLITMCQDNGLLVLQMAPNTWPFPESTPSASQH